jgi:hypothetical protein
MSFDLVTVVLCWYLSMDVSYCRDIFSDNSAERNTVLLDVIQAYVV